jgi:hypothetical protein
MTELAYSDCGFRVYMYIFRQIQSQFRPETATFPNHPIIKSTICLVAKDCVAQRKRFGCHKYKNCAELPEG